MKTASDSDGKAATFSPARCDGDIQSARVWELRHVASFAIVQSDPMIQADGWQPAAELFSTGPPFQATERATSLSFQQR